MNGVEIAKQLQENIQGILPKSFVSVKFTYNLYPCITLRFAKDTIWSNNIIQNDPAYMLFFIDGFKRIERDTMGELLSNKIKLEVRSNNLHKINPLRNKTASPEKMIEYITNYFVKLNS